MRKFPLLKRKQNSWEQKSEINQPNSKSEDPLSLNSLRLFPHHVKSTFPPCMFVCLHGCMSSVHGYPWRLKESITYLWARFSGRAANTEPSLQPLKSVFLVTSLLMSSISIVILEKENQPHLAIFIEFAFQRSQHLEKTWPHASSTH